MDKESILLKSEILSLPNGMRVDGYAFVRNYTEQPTKNGTLFIVGQLECLGTVQFKIWSGNTFNQVADNPIKDTICRVIGEVNEYAGTKSLIIKEVYPYDGDELVPTDFLEVKYDVELMFNKSRSIIASSCDENTLEIFDIVMEPIKPRILTEFAAVSHHDACVGGLIAHTSKVVRLAQIIKFYPTLFEAVDKEALFLGAAFHDIGKILEYNNGSLSELGKTMSHLTLGMELIRPYRESIVSRKGETFYNNIVSVIQQHHGEYGERPRTLVAYIVSIIDSLEARLTDIQEQVIKARNGVVKIDDYKLSFNAIKDTE